MREYKLMESEVATSIFTYLFIIFHKYQLFILNTLFILLK